MLYPLEQGRYRMPCPGPVLELWRRGGGCALRLVDHGGELGAGGDLCDDVIEQRGDRARHAGVEARVLPQDRGGERRAGARQAGDEVKGAARWQGGHRRLRHPRLAAWRVQQSKPQALRIRLRAYRPARRVVKGKPSTLQGSRRAFNADFIRTLADEFRLFCDGYAFLEGLMAPPGIRKTHLWRSLENPATTRAKLRLIVPY